MKGQVTTPPQAIKIVTSLADNALGYAAILNSDHEYWNEYGEETRFNLSNLIMLGIGRLHPITLAVIRYFSRVEIPRAIQYLLCAAVRITVAGPPAGTLEQHIATGGASYQLLGRSDRSATRPTRPPMRPLGRRPAEAEDTATPVEASRVVVVLPLRMLDGALAYEPAFSAGSCQFEDGGVMDNAGNARVR